MFQIKFIILFILGLVTNQTAYAAAAYNPTDDILSELSEIDKRAVRWHDRSPAKALITRYNAVFSGGAADEIDVSGISRRARVIFIAGCLNTNINFIYDVLKPEGDPVIPRADSVPEDNRAAIDAKFTREDAYYTSKFPIKIKFGDMKVTITPRPTQNQHGNFLLDVDNPVGISKAYSYLIEGEIADIKPEALALLKRHELFPLTVETVSDELGIADVDQRNSARNRLNTLTLLWETEISRRYVSHKGVDDIPLASLPYVFAIATSTDLDQLIKCFKGNAASRKAAMKGILKEMFKDDHIKGMFKSHIIGLLGGEDESDEE